MVWFTWVYFWVFALCLCCNVCDSGCLFIVGLHMIDAVAFCYVLIVLLGFLALLFIACDTIVFDCLFIVLIVSV